MPRVFVTYNYATKVLVYDMEDGFDVFKHKCASKFTVLNDFRVCLNQHLFPEVEGIEELEMNDSVILRLEEKEEGAADTPGQQPNGTSGARMGESVSKCLMVNEGGIATCNLCPAGKVWTLLSLQEHHNLKDSNLNRLMRKHAYNEHNSEYALRAPGPKNAQGEQKYKLHVSAAFATDVSEAEERQEEEVVVAEATDLEEEVVEVEAIVLEEEVVEVEATDLEEEVVEVEATDLEEEVAAYMTCPLPVYIPCDVERVHKWLKSRFSVREQTVQHSEEDEKVVFLHSDVVANSDVMPDTILHDLGVRDVLRLRSDKTRWETHESKAFAALRSRFQEVFGDAFALWHKPAGVTRVRQPLDSKVRAAGWVIRNVELVLDANVTVPTEDAPVAKRARTL